MDVLGEEELEVETKAKNGPGGLPGFEKLTPEEQNKQMVKMFNEVFSTPHGKIVLGVILEDLYYFAPCSNDESRALNNYAKTLISQRLGKRDHMKHTNMLVEL